MSLRNALRWSTAAANPPSATCETGIGGQSSSSAASELPGCGTYGAPPRFCHSVRVSKQDAIAAKARCSALFESAGGMQAGYVFGSDGERAVEAVRSLGGR